MVQTIIEAEPFVKQSATEIDIDEQACLASKKRELIGAEIDTEGFPRRMPLYLPTQQHAPSPSLSFLTPIFKDTEVVEE